MSIPVPISPLGKSFFDKDEPFQWTIEITNAPQTFTAFTNSIKHFIDWGDGTTIESSNGDLSHQYTENGIYKISVINTSGKPNTKFRIFGNSPNLVIDCNYKWKSLGDVRWIQFVFGASTSYRGRTCTNLPETLTSMEVCFGYPSKVPCFISKIPNSVTNLSNCGNVNNKAIYKISSLPPNIRSLFRAFRLCNRKSCIDIGAIIRNAPSEGFTVLTNVTGFCDSDRNNLCSKFNYCQIFP